MTRASGSSLRRFESPEIDTSRAMGLTPGHAALREARTIFPASVMEPWDSPRFLVSGVNNPKLGKAVAKGPRAGWPIYHVTLEERATCPTSCALWAGCYGNAMPYARRHRPTDDFIGLLKAEVLTVARQHPDGLLIRLHTLGDFYSVEYVRAWAELLDALPQLHVFGYTARNEDDGDEQSRAIAKAIRKLADHDWNSFAIRFSRSEPGPQRSIVVDETPTQPDVILCPAQTHASEACATCGLCWAAGARSKTIAFLRHGMKRASPGPRLKVVRPAPPPSAVPTRLALRKFSWEAAG